MSDVYENVQLCANLHLTTVLIVNKFSRVLKKKKKIPCKIIFVSAKLIVHKFIFVLRKLIAININSLRALKAQQQRNVYNNIYELMGKNLRKLLKRMREDLSKNLCAGALYAILNLKTRSTNYQIGLNHCSKLTFCTGWSYTDFYP